MPLGGNRRNSIRKGRISAKSRAAALVLALVLTLKNAPAITLTTPCPVSLVAKTLETTANLKPDEALIVAQSMQAPRIYELIELSLRVQEREAIAQRVFTRLRSSRDRWAANELERRADRLIALEINHALARAINPMQQELLAAALADVLRWSDRRNTALTSWESFRIETSRALSQRVKRTARDILRFEIKRSRALAARGTQRNQFDRLGVRMLSAEEETWIGLPSLATPGDFRDHFEILVFTSLFRDGSNSDWALCTAGESLRTVLGHGDGESSADLLALNRESGALWIIEIKRSPTAIGHAVEQLVETHRHLRRIGVDLGTSTALALPKALLLSYPYDESPDGFLQKNKRTIFLDHKPIHIMRF